MSDLSYQARVVTERGRLAADLERLLAFTQAEDFEKKVPNEAERALLVTQAEVMQTYLNILTQRMALWGK